MTRGRLDGLGVGLVAAYLLLWALLAFAPERPLLGPALPTSGARVCP